MRIIAVAACALAIAFGLVATRPAGAESTIVRVGMSLSTYNNLPIYLAIDKGYFRAAGLDVQVQPFSGSSTAQIPRLTHGDVDIMTLASGPAFFNQAAEGFNLRLVAGLEGPQAGWNDTTWLVVRQDLWDTAAVRRPEDLRGKHVDGVAPGSPIDYLALATIARGGLTENDVQFTEKFRDAPSWIAAFRNKAVDVQGVPEPIATELQEQKLGHKWISLSTVAPWFNDGFVAASATFARDHHVALVGFLRAYLRAVREIERAHGTWTPELVTSVAKWTQLPPSLIRQVPGPAHAGNGHIDISSLAKQENFWIKRGLVPAFVPPGDIVDTSALREAEGSK
jgi:NitT/TauT family transport system substrate-binding protein